MHSRLVGRHAHHPHKRAQLDLVSILIMTDIGVWIECPDLETGLEFSDPQARIDRAGYPSRSIPSPGSGKDLDYMNGQRHARLRTANSDGAAERVTAVATLNARGELSWLFCGKYRTAR